MDATTALFRNILHQLSLRYCRGLSLEELTLTVAPLTNIPVAGGTFYGRNAQSIVLDALLVLHAQGYIFLNPMNDHSCITIKGLIKADSTLHCN